METAVLEEESRKTAPHHTFFLLSAEWHEQAVRLMVGLVMFSIYLWIAAGVVHLGMMLYGTLEGTWSKPAKLMVTDVVILLAALELVRTLQSYLQIGRVRVTFILDAALVVLIGELISLWYRDYNTIEVVLSLLVIVLLTVLRMVTFRFSPSD
ncbi:MAG TPA: phosphate-starvation-inducible PsiE family protein [Mariprofundaceae bacterium]|nr:phosphate-starvation-inducible PsiE family protein [Mariprofundaceae bacterium]